MNLMPNDKDLLIDKDFEYKCNSCYKTMLGSEIKFHVMPSNITIGGLNPESKIPKCLYCGTLAFFGFENLGINLVKLAQR